MTEVGPHPIREEKGIGQLSDSVLAQKPAGVACAGVIQGYGGQVVIDGLTLSAVPGPLWLLGPNGAGKTTLLRTLCAIMPPRAGRLHVLGNEVHSESSARRARASIGFLPQEPPARSSFTVTEFVRYALWLRAGARGGAKPAVTRAIEAVGLENEARTPMRRLSGGMLQRAGLAGAIVGDPPIVVLDEPTAGLDPAQRLGFRSVLRDRSSSTVIVSTHLVEDVRAVGGRVVVLAGGRVVFDGSPEDVEQIADPASPGDSPFERGYMALLKQADIA